MRRREPVHAAAAAREHGTATAMRACRPEVHAAYGSVVAREKATKNEGACNTWKHGRGRKFSMRGFHVDTSQSSQVLIKFVQSCFLLCYSELGK